MKENNGAAGRRKRHKRSLQLIGLLITVLTLSWCYKTLTHDPPKARRPQRRKFNMNLSQKSTSEISKLIRYGKLHLVDLQIPEGALSPTLPDHVPYKGVIGKFCHVDWDLHKGDPSSHPMFKDLMKWSIGCSAGSVKANLHSIVTTIREYDDGAHEGKFEVDRDGNEMEVGGGIGSVHTMEPKGFVFHESRCGSTLVANTLAVTDPDTTRVYSESPPPITAAKACANTNNKNCSHKKSIQLLRDVIYLMGRTDRPEETNLFFKIQSIGTHSIANFREAFPKTPWIFVFRDPVQVIMSHLRNGSGAVCLRSKHRPLPMLKDLVRTQHGRPLQSLTDEEFCAAHLASLCESAYAEFSKPNSHGKMVDYADILNVLVEEILPHHFNIALDEEAKRRIYDVNQMYSKGRGEKQKVWKEDNKDKEEKAWPSVKDACSTFLQPSFEKLKGEATKLK